MTEFDVDLTVKCDGVVRLKVEASTQQEANEIGIGYALEHVYISDVDQPPGENYTGAVIEASIGEVDVQEADVL